MIYILRLRILGISFKEGIRPNLAQTVKNFIKCAALEDWQV
jgi:hypothetical protein